MTIKLKGSTAGSVSLVAPADTSPSGTDVSFTLPTTAGTAGQVLKNGSTAGTLEFASAGLVQFVSTSSNTRSSTSNAIPFDDTTPQNTEGLEVLSVSITPTSSTNKLLIEAFVPACDANVAAGLTAALFQDSGADAIATASVVNAATNFYDQLGLVHIMDAGTTSATTFKIRVGPSSGTMFFNRRTDANLFFNSTLFMTLTVKEIQP